MGNEGFQDIVVIKDVPIISNEEEEEDDDDDEKQFDLGGFLASPTGLFIMGISQGAFVGIVIGLIIVIRSKKRNHTKIMEIMEKKAFGKISKEKRK